MRKPKNGLLGRKFRNNSSLVSLRRGKRETRGQDVEMLCFLAFRSLNFIHYPNRLLCIVQKRALRYFSWNCSNLRKKFGDNSTAREKYDTEFKEISTKTLAMKNGLSEDSPKQSIYEYFEFLKINEDELMLHMTNLPLFFRYKLPCIKQHIAARYHKIKVVYTFDFLYVVITRPATELYTRLKGFRCNSEKAILFLSSVLPAAAKQLC